MRETASISAGDLVAEIVPSLGGGLARFDLIRNGSAAPLFRPRPDVGTNEPVRLACFPLIPWSNRISGGGFHYGGRFHPLAANFASDPFPIHGNGWTSPWTVTAKRASRVVLELMSEGPGPYRYRGALDYALDPRGLGMRLAVTNRAEMALPFGLGFHPWLPRSQDTWLHAPAATVWLEDSRYLPAGSVPITVREDWDFSMPRMLPPGWVNNAFTGWNGRATIEWRDRELALDVAAGEGLNTYLLYSPNWEADFFCFEPISHLVDAHNLPGGPVANGLVVLAPGEELSVSCRFSPHERFEDDPTEPLQPLKR